MVSEYIECFSGMRQVPKIVLQQCLRLIKISGAHCFSFQTLDLRNDTVDLSFCLEEGKEVGGGLSGGDL